MIEIELETYVTLVTENIRIYNVLSHKYRMIFYYYLNSDYIVIKRLIVDDYFHQMKTISMLLNMRLITPCFIKKEHADEYGDKNYYFTPSNELKLMVL